MPLTQFLPTSDNNHIEKNGFGSSFKFHPNGLEVVGDPSLDQWKECGKLIYKYNQSLHFAIGDWLNYGELHWKDTYKQACAETGFDYQTLRNDKWVASRIDLSRRRDTLSWSHHSEVASLMPDEQEEFLAAAEQQEFNRNEFRKFVAEQTMQTEPKTEKPVYTASDATKDMEQIICSAQTLTVWLSDLDISLLSDDEHKRLNKSLLELRRKIEAICVFN